VELLEQLRDRCKSLSVSKRSTSLRVAVAGRKSQNMLIRPNAAMSLSVSVLVMADAPAPLDILFLRTERSEGAGASGAPRRNGDAAT
jgi:hypothetical protein